jgi:hypothetical protein
MTIRQRLGIGIGGLMTLFVALGVFSYLRTGQIGDGIEQIIQNKTLGKRAVVLHKRYRELDSEVEKRKHFLLYPCDEYGHPKHKSRPRGSYLLLRTPAPEVILILST